MLAHKYGDSKEEVNQKWNSLLEHEKNLMRELKIINLFMINN